MQHWRLAAAGPFEKIGGVVDGVRASQVGVLLLLSCLEVAYSRVVLQAVPTVDNLLVY